MPIIMNNDPKMDVLFTCYDAIKSLDAGGKEWVISQLGNRLGITKTPDVHIEPKARDEQKPVNTKKPSDTSPAADDDFAEAFVKVNPKTEDKKVLFAAWLLFGKNGLQDFGGLQVSKRLKLTGHAINSVSVCLGRLREQKPALVVQIGSSGNKRQSRKSYRLTNEGIKAAQKMLESTAGQ